MDYLPTKGIKELNQLLMTMTKALHTPPESTWQNVDITVCSGAYDGYSKILDMLVNKGDSLIMEEFAFAQCVLGLQQRQ